MSGRSVRNLARGQARLSEHKEQCAIVDHVHVAFRRLWHHMTAVPLGGLRKKATAGRLRAEGARAGYPDLLFDVPRGPFYGLRIETKRTGGVPSDVTDEQQEWHDRLTDAGYYVAVAYGAAHGIVEVARYWHLGPFALTTPPIIPIDYKRARQINLFEAGQCNERAPWRPDR